jgi:hypothetical protein
MLDTIICIGASVTGLIVYLAALSGPAKLVSRYLDKPQDPCLQRDR